MGKMGCKLFLEKVKNDGREGFFSTTMLGSTSLIGFFYSRHQDREPTFFQGYEKEMTL